MRRTGAFAGTAAALVLLLSFTVPATSPTPSNPAFRLQVYSKAAPQLPATQDWTLEYEFIVPPLPTPRPWNYKVGTVYQWGDVDFDSYGSKGKYKLSDYQFNQIVPQLILGNVLDGNNADFAPSWHQRDTWGIQAQYYWYNATTSTSYAQAGRIVNVNPGDEITTTISFNARTGTIVASIADQSLSGSVGASTITIARPFPNDPSLFASWSDFFNRAATASKTSYVMSTPAADVETDYVDQPTMCGLLPFRLRRISIPGVAPTPSAFSIQQPNGLTCAQALAKFDF